MYQVRIDDIGASTKQFEQYGKKILKYKDISYFYFPLADWGFFKRIRPFQGWGPYEELTVEEWKKILEVFESHTIQPLVAVTASWVEHDGTLTPFPQKFPEEAQFLKQAADAGKVTIANHGLTHSVIGRHLPHPFRGNRNDHREFWPWMPAEIHDEHIEKSQEILESFFERKITILVPPGNVWSSKTYVAAQKYGITKIICNRYMLDSDELMEGVEFIDDRKGYINLHDRELKKGGALFLNKILNSHK